MSNTVARLLLLATASLTLPTLAADLPQAWQSKVEASVLTTAIADGESEFFIKLSQQADVSGAYQLKTKAEKGIYVYEQLTGIASKSQAPLLKQLKTLGAPHKSFWIANVIQARGDAAVIQTIAERGDVERILAMGYIEGPRPVEEDDAERSSSSSVVNNLTHINADDVWAMGITGQGAVVGGADTGVSWEHEALKKQYRGWNAIDNVATHDYNWFAAALSEDCLDDDIPCDGGSHGTHTMGTMVGDNGSTEQIGIAPGAKWIGCRNHHAGTAATLATYLSCMEFMLAPSRTDGSAPDPTLAPDAVNNSWSCAEGCGHLLVTPLENSVAAGIFYGASAGNDGPTCSTDVLPLSSHEASFSTASTIHNGANADKISGFSSRGPVLTDSDASGVPKPARTSPDIAAPGSTVRSATFAPASYGNKSGTSMATPHVTGLVALLVSANPELKGNVPLIQQIMIDTAVQLHPEPSDYCGDDTATSIPNNTFGWGRIDALAAVEMAIADTDNDGKTDLFDNCIEVANPSQCNSNPETDSFGNHCDADLDDNGIVNTLDLSFMRASFGTTAPAPFHVADLDCNGVVNTLDLTIMRQAFGKPPGPGSAN